MQISVKSDLKRVSRKLTSIQRKQIPFATANALNDTAFDVRTAEMQQVGRHIDRPTPFTVKGFQVKKASKRTLLARVFIPDSRWKYMKYAVGGGVAPGNSNVPTKHTPLNQYGAMRRNYLKNALNRKTTFSGTAKGISGVWRRKRGGGLELLAAYEQNVMYKAIFPFRAIAERQIRSDFSNNLRRQLRRALASAK